MLNSRVTPISESLEPRPYLAGWSDMHDTFVRETTRLVEAPGNGHLDILFLGDSITEAYRGTDKGGKCFGGRCDFVPEVFKENFGHLKTAIFGIGGDETKHLLWRLKDGEMHKTLPRVTVILIGTNNLGAAFHESAAAIPKAEELTVRGVQEVVKHVFAEAPGTQIILLALLPRGERSWEQPHSGSSVRFISHVQPSPFTKTIENINGKLEEWVKTAAFPSAIQFLDCSTLFLTEDQKAIKEELMEDALHPTPQGYKEMLGKCLLPKLTTIRTPNTAHRKILRS
ncbi:hypothetical protein CYMTET_29394 [Cymbomonas tetramitiformis]|uniref:SGNH hydrolase-type esterase domain-containing protein n=1 Tax=Cymbomonas tetramitiformis TaxID=36881 RepID=A0AAE0KV71_9CHLO|nr:hypothetical protein CYMTET_29394 [Cymbomonas tetramitiformis]